MVQLHFHGHACWEITNGNHRVLIDPFLTGNPLADVGPDSFDKLDAILLSHGHGDHLGDTEQIAKRTGALVVSNFEIVSHLQSQGCAGHPLHIGGGYRFPFGHVKLTIAHHGSTGPGGEALAMLQALAVLGRGLGHLDGKEKAALGRHHHHLGGAEPVVAGGPGRRRDQGRRRGGAGQENGEHRPFDPLRGHGSPFTPPGASCQSAPGAP